MPQVMIKRRKKLVFRSAAILSTLILAALVYAGAVRLPKMYGIVEASFPQTSAKTSDSNTPPMLRVGPKTSKTKAQRPAASLLPVAPVNGYIAYNRYFPGGRSIRSVAPDGIDSKDLVQFNDDFDASFSGDGTRFVFTSSRDRATGNTTNDQEIYSADADGRDQRRLTYNGDPDRQPAFSPDRSKIAFISQRAGDSGDEVYLMNSDGSGQARLTDGGGDFAENPSFSPDGLKVIFDREGDIFTIDIDGTNETQINLDSHYFYSPAFSPDGTQIVVSGGDIGFAQYLWIANVDGSGLQTVMNLQGVEDGHPVWSPDGTKIAYVDYVSGKTDIYIFDRLLNTSTNLTNTSSDENIAHPTWQPVGAGCESISNGLVGWWRGESFDQNGITLDATRRGHDGTREGNVSIQPGTVGSAYDLTSSDDAVIRVDDDDELDVERGDFSMDLWIYPRDGSRHQFVAGKDAGGNSYYLTIEPGSKLRFTQTDISGNHWILDAVIDLDSWSHVAAVRNGSSMKLFYPNGSVSTNNGLTVDETQNFAPFTIGRTNSSGCNCVFDGRIDELRLWNRALTNAEIDSIVKGDTDRNSCSASLSIEQNYPNPVSAGGQTTANIRLGDYAPQGGAVVDLSVVGDPNAISIPSSVSIPEYTNFAQVQIQTAVTNSWKSVDIVATYSGRTAISTLTIAPSAPDLTVSNFTPPASVEINSNFSANWTDSNIGFATTGTTTWADCVFFSPDPDYGNGNDTNIGCSYTDGTPLDPAGSRPVTYNNLNIPGGAVPADGDYYLIVFTNTYGSINEREKFFINNYQAVPVHVYRNQPDYVPESVTAPATIEPLTSFNVSWTTRNAGTQAGSVATVDRVYFSTDTVAGNADDRVLSGVTTGPLAAGNGEPHSVDVQLATLPELPSGDYYIYVLVDANNSISEGSETNNATFKPIHLDYVVPDLQVTASSAPPEPETDTPFALNWTDLNAGNRDAGPYTDRVYFSTDNQVGGDTFLGDFPTAGLAQGQSVNRIQNVTIPTSAVAASGDYYVYVVTDALGSVDEGAAENNNVRFQNVHVRRFLRPDLEVTNITAPTSAFFDQTIQVQWTVTNNGPGPTNSNQWTDGIYLSNAPSLAGLLLTPTNVNSLNVGESYITTASVKIPRGYSGIYYLSVRCDDNLQVNEENENNNVLQRSITINVPPVPDLTVSNVQAPSQGFAGQVVPINWTVSNSGTGATFPGETSWSDLVYISTDTTFDNNDIFVGRRDHTGSLAQGANYTVSGFNVTLPPNIIGDYYVFVVTDGFGQVYEFTSEGNNFDYDRVPPGSPMNVTAAPPDLVVSSVLTAPATSNAASSASVTFSVRNQGAFDAVGGWFDAVYLSNDQTLSTDDTLLGYSPPHNLLAAGAEYLNSFSVQVPACISGPYYLIAAADFNQQLFEYDPNFDAEANNTSVPLPITINSYFPDLAVSAVSATPGSVTGGQPIQVNWTVQNFGNAPTNYSYWVDRVYLGTTPGSTQFPVGSFEHTQALPSLGSYNESRSIVVPGALEGNYYVTVVTDSVNSIIECSGEANNSNTAGPITVANSLPDLQVTTIDPVPTAVLGTSTNVQWTAVNAGLRMLQPITWRDQVFLSNDNVYQDYDRPIGSTLTSAALEANESYNASASVMIPNVQPGNYFLIVYADSAGNIAEGLPGSTAESNNWLAIPITLTAPGVDLQATNVSVPLPSYSGLSTTASWTVTNTGSSATLSSEWTDYVVISRDSVFDTTDRVIGYLPHAGVLAGGASYNASVPVFIPAGFTGDYSIFVYTDRGNTVTESDEGNNVSLPFNLTLALPPPSELNITNITVPANASPGELATFTWTVQNTGPNAAMGMWQDTVYLSQDDVWDVSDTIVGTQTHLGPVAPSATYTENLTVALPPIETGTYHVIVRTDARNNVRETNEANNLASSVLTVDVEVQQLTLGVPLNTTLVTGQEHYYRYDTTADETLLVTLAGEAGSSNELYTRFGSIVSRANYELQGSRQGEADQENVVDNTNAGTYYSMIRGDYIPGSFRDNLRRSPQKSKKTADGKDKPKLAPSTAENVTVNAAILPFSVRRVTPGFSGNQGFTVIAAEGAKFQEGATMKLVGPGGIEITPLYNYYHSQAKVAALFDMNEQAAGNYQVVVTNPNSQSAVWAEYFEIRNGGGGPRMRTEIFGPGKVRGDGATFNRYIVSVSNDGSNDAITVPIIIILPGPSEYRLSTQNYLPNTDDPSYDPLSANGFHADIDGRRVIALWSPIVRAGEKVEIGIDVNFAQAGNMIADALNPLFNIGTYPDPTAPGLMPPPRTTHPIINCWTHLVLKSILTALGELLPQECALEVVSSITGLAEDGLGYVRTGEFDLYGAFVSVFSKATKSSAICAKYVVRNLPWIRWVTLFYDVWQTLGVAWECLTKTFPSLKEISFDYTLDPNEKIGPDGYGPERFVAIQSPMLYRINFENVPEATAPVQRISVVDQLPPGLDPRSVRLLEIGFKQYRIEVPTGRAFYQGRLQLGPDLNNLVADISAGLNIVNNRITWNLTAIDPATGELTLNSSQGILPPNNVSHDGEGYVTFVVSPAAGQPTRTSLANKATIYFDRNEPIDTNTTANLLDADIPTSSVSPLAPTQSSPTFSVSWTGGDDPNGSGLHGFDAYYSEDGGPFTQFAVGTPELGTLFKGKWGRSYRFYTLARDNAGNIEPAPAVPDATTQVVGGISEADVFPRPDGEKNGSIDGSDVDQVRRFVAKLDTDYQVNEFQRADSAPFLTAGDGVLSVADVIESRRFQLGLDPIVDSAGPLAAGGLTGKVIDGKRSGLLPRELRPARVTLVGNTLWIAVDLESQGDEAGASFTLNFNPAHLTLPQNIALGADAAGANLTVNSSDAANGNIGIIIDKAPNQPFAAGTREMLTMSFTVVDGGPTSTDIGFSTSPVTNEIADGNAQALSSLFTTANVSLLSPTAAGVRVAGQVQNAAGHPVGNAVVVLTSASGTVRTAVSNPFGSFEFDDVMIGETYVVTVKHRIFEFRPRIISVSDQVSDLIIIANQNGA